MEKIRMYVPLSEWDLKVLKDDEFYRKVYRKDFEKVLASVSFTNNKGDWYNVLVQLCFGSRDGNAWIDTSFWEKRNDFYGEVESVLPDPLHDGGFLQIKYEGMVIDIQIGDE
jgi:hypothetical protein